MTNTPRFFKTSLLALSCGASTFALADELNLKPGGIIEAQEQAPAVMEQLRAEQVVKLSALPQAEPVQKLDDSNHLVLDSQPLAPAAIKMPPAPVLKLNSNLSRNGSA